MPSPRWFKVLRDLWSNKLRTGLVVLSIAVGVFAVGLITSSQVILDRDMNASYQATNPASATLYVSRFNDDLVQTVRHVPGVRDAEGRDSIRVRYQSGPNEWRELQLRVIPNYNAMRIGVIRPSGGAWPPPKRTMLLERGSIDYLNAGGQSSGLIETPDGKRGLIRIVGTVHDLSVPQATVDGEAFGYISLDTYELLSGTRDLGALQIVVADRADDREHIQQVVGEVQEKIEKGGYRVYGSDIRSPGQHWAAEVIKPLLLIMGVLGVLSLLLSGFLVINTIGAVLTQQTRQIGIMKAIGARTSQVTGLYLSTVLIFGLLALLVAVPLGAIGAQALISFLAGLLNFDVISFTIPPQVLALEIGAGLIVPLLAALWPIVAGTRVTVNKALNWHGLSTERSGDLIERLLVRLRWLSRPLLLSLRNTFRRRARMALTLMTLTLAGAMLMAVISLRASLLLTNDKIYQTYNMDIFVDMDWFYRIDQMRAAALKVPGVAEFEAWGNRDLRRLRGDKTQSGTIKVIAPPADTRLFRPTIIAGRWLLPDDQNAVVIASDLLQNEPDLKVGDDLVLLINERQTHWRIVGIAQVINAQNSVYANYPYFAQAARLVDRAGKAVVVTTRHDAESRKQVAYQLSQQLKQAGLGVGALRTVSDEKEETEAKFNIIVVFLMIMALLLGIVGGLGLMGTMSINVLERTREIGVLRAIGASNGAVLRIVIVEGLLIGLLSWAIASLLALPLGKLLSDAVGMAFIQMPLSYTFSPGGVLLWLVIVLALSALASFLPAWRAVHLTVRDVLAYE